MMDMLDPWYLGAGLLIAVVVVVALMWEKGWLGGRARLVQMIAKAEHDLAGLRAKLEMKIANDAMKASAPSPSAAGNKAGRIADNAALLAAGQITQEDFDAAKSKILAE
ncbi:MAG: hypothetical protein ABI831_06805 [Betaproteobacteria bacterium]